MIKELRSKIAEKKLIPVVGAGVSQATAGFPNWPNLIENGIEYIKERNLEDDEGLDEIRQLLAQWKLPDAARKLKAVLGTRYRAWLEYVFGNPKIKSTLLRDSIINLQAPFLLTTNFDGLLNCSVRYNNAYSWLDAELVRLALEKNERFIFHLHGSYQKPDSTIFGDDDYEKIVANKGYRLILNTIFLQYSLLFIGCSKDGVLDADFTAAIEFFAGALPDTGHQHYLLMRSGESTTADTREFLLKYNIQIVGFGDSRDDLPGFINGLNDHLEEAEEISELEKQLNQRLDDIFSGRSIVNRGKNKDFTLFVGNDPKLIRELFDKRQKESTDKRKEFESQQKLLRQDIDEEKLGALIASFVEFAWREEDDPSEIIDMALKASNLLDFMPRDTLRRIKRFSYSAINDSWFNGYLKTFVNLYQAYKAKGREASFNDRYYIKNLWLILKCLKGVLEADPSIIFPQLSPESKVFMDYVSEGIVITTSDKISIRDVVIPDKELAFIAAEEGMVFICSELVYFKGQQFVIGCNKQVAFHWDPYQGIFVVPFFEADSAADIDSVKCFNSADGGLLTYILVGKRLHVYKDFEFLRSLSLHADIRKSSWLQKGRLLIMPLSGSHDEVEVLDMETQAHVRYSGDYIWQKMMDIPMLRNALGSKIDGWIEKQPSGSTGITRLSALLDPFFRTVVIRQKEYVAMGSVIYDTFAGAVNVVLFLEVKEDGLSVAGFHLNGYGVLIDVDVIDGESPVLMLANHGLHNREMNYLQSLELVQMGHCFTFMEKSGNLPYPQNRLDLHGILGIQAVARAVTYDYDKKFYVFGTDGTIKGYGPLNDYIHDISVFTKRDEMAP